MDPTLAVLIETLQHSEGFRSFVYDDRTWPSRRVWEADCYRFGSQYRVHRTGGVATIGFGETSADVIAEHWDKPMSWEDAVNRMTVRARRDFLTPALEMLPEAGGYLNPNQKAAIGSFAYNVGVGGWQASTLRRYIEQRRLDRGSIEAAFHMWDNPDGSLRGRREVEIDLFFTPWSGPPSQPADDWPSMVAVLVEG